MAEMREQIQRQSEGTSSSRVGVSAGPGWHLQLFEIHMSKQKEGWRKLSDSEPMNLS